MGYKIKDLRKSMKMTQQELAEKSGVSRATIVALENGTDNNTTTGTLLKISRALDTTVDALFFEDGV